MEGGVSSTTSYQTQIARRPAYRYDDPLTRNRRRTRNSERPFRHQRQSRRTLTSELSDPKLYEITTGPHPGKSKAQGTVRTAAEDMDRFQKAGFPESFADQDVDRSQRQLSRLECLVVFTVTARIIAAAQSGIRAFPARPRHSRQGALLQSQRRGLGRETASDEHADGVAHPGRHPQPGHDLAAVDDLDRPADRGSTSLDGSTFKAWQSEVIRSGTATGRSLTSVPSAVEAPMTWPPLTPPPARATLKTLGKWSRPALRVDLRASGRTRPSRRPGSSRASRAPSGRRSGRRTPGSTCSARFADPLVVLLVGVPAVGPDLDERDARLDQPAGQQAALAERVAAVGVAEWPGSRRPGRTPSCAARGPSWRSGV